MTRWTRERELARMFALGGATLMLEVLLTRIAAVTLFANLAFGVIALSLFGLAVGSAWAERWVFAADEDRERAIRTALLGAAFFTLLSAVLATKLPLVPEELSLHGKVASSFTQRRNAFESDPGQVHWGLVALLVVSQAIPFALAGYAQAHAFARGRTPASRLYAADLAGATLGSLATLALLRSLGAADGVGCVAILFVASASFGTSPLRRKEKAAATLAAALAALVLAFHPFAIVHAAGFSEKRIIAVDWSALARIGLYDREDKPGSGLEEPTLVVDNTSATDVAFTKDARFGANLERIPYLLRPEGDVLVVGAGGGQEIETALATAPGRKRHVDAVELADGEERLLRRFFGTRPDFLLDQPGVDYRIGDGRSYLEMTTRRWDVIQMKEVNFHSFAGQAASAWSPSLLFTTEALTTELQHLTKNGFLAINKGIYAGGDVASTLEMVATMRVAADALGWDLGSRLVIVDRPRPTGFHRMFLVSAAPLEDSELGAISAIAEDTGLHVRRSPRLPYKPIESVVRGSFAGALAQVRAERGILVRATTDDHPFGYQYLPFVSAVFGSDPSESTTPHTELQRTDYRFLLGGIVAIAILTIALLVRSTQRTSRGRRAASARQLAICGLLGIGFMLLEVILVERTSLLLGHPTVGFVAVVTSMLCGLGIGSSLSGRFLPERSVVRVAVLAVVTLAFIAGLAAAPAWAAPWFQSVSPSWRPWVAALPLLIGAIPLGAILPSVLRIAATTQAATPAGCWSINAACSVLGTLGAALLVRSVGFAATSRLGWLLYALALGLWFEQARRLRPVRLFSPGTPFIQAQLESGDDFAPRDDLDPV